VRILIASLLIAFAAAAGAQSYDQRAEAERAAAALAAIDKAEMDKARQRALLNSPITRHKTDWTAITLAVGFVGVVWLLLRSKK
jgi:hypothetical protein